MNNTLPPMNGSAASADMSPSFHNAGGSGYALPRPYNSSLMSSSTARSPPQGIFSHVSHTHPQDSLPHTPKRGSDASFEMRGNGVHYSQSPMIRDPQPPSPKEMVS
jgi:hypothetical protein